MSSKKKHSSIAISHNNRGGEGEEEGGGGGGRGGGGGGTIALLNLPAYSVLSMNTSASQTLKNDEPLLVISNIRPSDRFHLLVVRGGCGSHENNNGATLHSTGILILNPPPNDDHDSRSSGSSRNWFIARKFDNPTEEISSQLLDEISYQNLRKAVELEERQGDNIHVARKIIPYERIFHSNNDELWSRFLTHFISKDVLSIHGLAGNGDKIVPGTFSIEENDDYFITTQEKKSKELQQLQEEDGHTLKYPPIPHVDPSQSHRINAHAGTKRFLSTLSPPERTKIFVSINYNNNKDTFDSSNVDIIFQMVLSRFYNGDWKILLGHLQLSFVLFLCCSCLASLEHWRDTIQMLSLVSPTTIMSYSDLFEQLLMIIQYQLFGLNNDLLGDQDILDGNCLIPAIRKLCIQCRDQLYNSDLKSHATALLDQLKKHVPDTDISEANGHSSHKLNHLISHEDDDDEDSPVVLSIDEVNASLERSSNTYTTTPTTKSSEKYMMYASKYPFLFASILDNEDILMTCARILDEKADVTCVREAAAYLEEVESLSSTK